MLINRKVTWEVASKTEKADGKVVLQLTPNAPEGVEYSSPGEGIFLTISAGVECTVDVNQAIEDLTVAQVEVEEPVEG